ncbi:hypothetical protein [Sediminicoccus sp. BL-A-41-H5]|uniref:hypothetical protein n=1 Tax=Sediminicoccus sp. BL-A-41-H5 TaxID=3421106 RepID=UPI003D67B8A2
MLLRHEGDDLDDKLSGPANARASFTGSQPAQPIQSEFEKLALPLCASQKDSPKLIDAWLIDARGVAKEVAV